MSKNILRLLLFITVLSGTILFIITGSRYVLIISVGIVCLLLVFMWPPLTKHTTFSDADRIKATSRALGGSGPPELWTPPGMPGMKKKKRKRK